MYRSRTAGEEIGWEDNWWLDLWREISSVHEAHTNLKALLATKAILSSSKRLTLQLVCVVYCSFVQQQNAVQRTPVLARAATKAGFGARLTIAFDLGCVWEGLGSRPRRALSWSAFQESEVHAVWSSLK
jgi:hypothetical protein